MKRTFFLVLSFLLILATSYALLHHSFFRVHDYVHAARIGEMLRGLQEGQLPVRWSAHFGYGYGMPLFEFYAPLPFYIGAAIFWSGIDVILVIKILYVLANIFTLLGAYFLGTRLFGRTGGWVTAAAYTLAPYRAVNLYIRGALSEAWAMMALPWVLLGIVLVVQKQKGGVWVLLAGLVTLLLSHNLTTLMFIPLSILFGAVYWLMYNWKHLKTALPQVFRLAGSYLLALGLSAFYIFPALAENSFTKIEQIFTGYFSYQNHFLYLRQFFIPNWGYGGSNWGPDDGISFFLGYGQLIGLALFGLLWIKRLFQQRRFTPQLVFYASLGGLLVSSVFMTLLRSKPIWDAIPLLLTIQFPWRWLSVGSLMLALLCGAGISLIPRKGTRLLLSVALILAILVNAQYFKPESYMEDPTGLYYTDPDKIERQMSQILPDYIPATMSDTQQPPTEKFLVPAGTEQHVELIIDRGSQKLFKTTFLTPVLFNPMIASFPGWKVEIDGQEVEWSSDGQQGTIAVEVPGGEHLVSVYFGDTPIRSASDTITLLSIIGLFGAATYVSLNSKRQRS